MELTILGCHSATPRNNARPTAQLLEMRGHLFLIDCGEATQIALRNANAKFSRIKHIFISHLHGDHFFGLFGLISTFQLLGREAEMHIYGPKGIKEAVLLVLKLGGAYTPFPLYFHELSGDTSEVLYEDDKVLVRTIPLRHRVYTNGFFFQEKEGERRLDMTAISNYPSIEKCDYQNIKSGKDVVLENGTIIPNEELTFAPHKPQSYAFCSDTLYFEALAEEIKGARVVYHEATFLKNNEELAAKTMHSTAYQAGLTAKNANAEVLILGHYSSRYNDIKLFKEEASEVFANVYLAEDGKKFVYQ
ncbi:ribonuclease Z [Capnocytophaga sp. oral taxon 332]|jgi:ribonuclease Z|uniref:ribonuclease Z n=1 Tax=Capnocytophaga sp. oral taxon 332 TaxID=712213 RepID=UPI0002A3911B|nr:ribonuclease Z [Capnocytophaga sp. oral taxon 332]EKY08987.1 ribonuclease Z [Capnocytophaga sp. oral taxon 332 str. F0381]